MDDMLLCPLELLTRVIYHDASLYSSVTKLNYIFQRIIFFVLFVKLRKERTKRKSGECSYTCSACTNYTAI